MSRRKVTVGETLLKNGISHLTMEGTTIRLFVFLIPAEPEPFQPLKDRVDRGFRIPFHVGVVETKNHRAVVSPDIEPVENEGAGAAYVKKSGGRRGKAYPGRAAGRRVHR